MNIKYNKALWCGTILASVMRSPFLGLTEFNTKGDPREAVVADNVNIETTGNILENEFKRRSQTHLISDFLIRYDKIIK